MKMKATNQEKSPYATFSTDPVFVKGEPFEKEQITNRIVGDGDLRAREVDKTCSTRTV